MTTGNWTGKTDMHGSIGRRTQRMAAVAMIAATLSVMVGCSSEEVASAPAQSSAPVATTTMSPNCIEVPVGDHRDADEKRLTAKLSKFSLPAGICFFAVDITELGGQPEALSVRVDLAVPTWTGPDDLRAVATDIAHLVKEDEVAQRTSIMRVTNWGYTKATNRDHLVDENFQAHPWDGTPSRESEMALWAVHKQK
ncbi:hypothetical protein [Nocardia gipuzkoensis]|uniref:hypothetical protein n=1 Tax=Nocardia gipuzkoensis TaxID=2749991 RepID=UPI003EDEA13C